MTYWETFKKIENDLDMLKCGIAQFTLNLWIDNVFKASGILQDQEMQNILKATAKDVSVKHYRVWEKEIFLIAETRKETV